MHFQLPIYFDFLATFIWATSGALLAARRGLAPLGVVTLAILSSTGGGLLRDGIFLQNGPPVLLTSPAYLQLNALAVLLVFLVGARINRIRGSQKLVGLVDALGLGAYAAVGMCHALEAGLTILGVVVVGMVNSVGGSVLRDILMREEVQLFQPGTLEQSIALLGCFLFLILLKLAHLNEAASAWITIVFVFTVRMLAIRFDVRTRPMAGYDASS